MLHSAIHRLPLSPTGNSCSAHAIFLDRSVRLRLRLLPTLPRWRDAAYIYAKAVRLSMPIAEKCSTTPSMRRIAECGLRGCHANSQPSLISWRTDGFIWLALPSWLLYLPARITLISWSRPRERASGISNAWLRASLLGDPCQRGFRRCRPV